MLLEIFLIFTVTKDFRLDGNISTNKKEPKLLDFLYLIKYAQ